MVLTLSVSLLLAVGAKVLGVALGLDPPPAPLLDLALVAILGGALASLVVLGGHPAADAGRRSLRAGTSTTWWPRSCRRWATC